MSKEHNLGDTKKTLFNTSWSRASPFRELQNGMEDKKLLQDKE